MAHELDFSQGSAAMFSVKETPWHGLGRIIQEAPTIEDGIRLAGLDWHVSQRKFAVTNDDGSNSSIDTEKYRAIVRDDTGEVLNVLTKDFTPLQNREAFDFFNPFLEAGQATLETAGSLRGGRRIWVLAKLSQAPIEVGKGDEILPFLLLSNGHDGSMAVRCGFTAIRVVCANTMAAAHGAKNSKLIRVAHSRNVVNNVKMVQEIVNAQKAQFEASAEQFKALARKQVSAEDLKAFVRIVFETHTVADAERRKIREEKLTADITRLFETGRGAELATAKGTAWGLYNTVSELLSYERSRTQDARLESLWFGDAAKINQRALDAAIKLAA